MTLYKNIIRQAVSIAWKSKYLWFFGFFAAILGNGGEYDFFVRLLIGDTDPTVLPGLDALLQSQLFTGEGIVNAARFFASDPISAIGATLILVMILLLIGFVVWLVNVSQIAVVDNAASVLSGGEEGGIKKGLEVGMDKFWPVLSFNLILSVVTGVLFLFINWSLMLSINNANYLTGKILYSVLFLLTIPILMSLSFIFKYSIAYIVIKGQKFRVSLNSGWALFSKNWLVSLEMAFVLFFVNIVSGLLFVLFSLMLATPVFLLVNLAISIKSLFAFWFVISVSITLFIAIFMAFAGILSSFQISAWTTLFMELTGKGAVSKIVRVFSKK
jgi:hypothetical protein